MIMISCFTALSTLTYRDEGRVTMKGSVQWSTIQSSWILLLARFKPETLWFKVLSTNHSATRMLPICKKHQLIELRFYSSVNPLGSCQAQSVYLTTLSLCTMKHQSLFLVKKKKEKYWGSHLLKFLPSMLSFNISGPSCSKQTMSLVNVSLKLWSLNMAYKLKFLLKKCE